MTLIVTVESPEVIVQVADRRTTRNGILVNNEVAKQIVVQCLDADLTMAYTGEAVVFQQPESWFLGHPKLMSERPTGEWAADVLASIGPHKLKVNQVLDEFQHHVNSAFCGRRLVAFVCVGYRYDIVNERHMYFPFTWRVDNLTVSTDHYRSDQLTRRWLLPEGVTPSPHHVAHIQLDGSYNAVNSLMRQQLTSAVSKAVRSKGDIAKMIVMAAAKTIQAASLSVSGKKFISRRCLSICIKPHIKAAYSGQYHGAWEKGTSYSGWIVTPFGPIMLQTYGGDGTFSFERF